MSVGKEFFRFEKEMSVGKKGIGWLEIVFVAGDFWSVGEKRLVGWKKNLSVGEKISVGKNCRVHFFCWLRSFFFGWGEKVLSVAKKGCRWVKKCRLEKNNCRFKFVFFG